jgi:hypothetical protein
MITSPDNSFSLAAHRDISVAVNVNALVLSFLFNPIFCHLSGFSSWITHQTVALDIVRRPKTTPIHELER